MKKFALIALLAGAFGCVDDYGSVYIASNVVPDDSCLVAPGNAVLTSGTFDYSNGARDYFLNPIVVNQLRRSRTDLMSDPNTVVLEGFEISLKTVEGDRFEVPGVAPNPYFVPVAIQIDSTSGQSPSSSGASFAAVPQNVMDGIISTGIVDSLRGTMVLGVRALARTQGGREFLSGEWDWPISLCDGCLTVCQPDDTSGLDPVCSPGQDNDPVYIQCGP